jgi:uncharacterized protein YqjF (DUF2071 family)
MRMRWLNLLFIHWPVAPAALRELVPANLEIDTFDGRAWVGLVPFSMRSVLPWVVPDVRGVSDLPGLSAFHECNVRTYVTHRGEPGVWFFSLDAASRLASWGARKFWRLPYFDARIELKRRHDEVQYTVRRNHGSAASMHCAWRAGASLPRSRPGELAHFLIERYMLYASDGKDELYRGRIWHDPWPLRQAELLALDDGLVGAAGITLGPEQPLLHHADELDVRAWSLERISSEA